MLSHDEDHQLRQIERWFEESDPALTRMLRAHEPPRRGWALSVGKLAVDLVGGALFVVGAAAASAVLMVFGILALGAGACLHVAART